MPIVGRKLLPAANRLLPLALIERIEEQIALEQLANFNTLLTPIEISSETSKLEKKTIGLLLNRFVNNIQDTSKPHIQEYKTKTPAYRGFRMTPTGLEPVTN